MSRHAKTGRTTRMLLDALRLCNGGRAVYVVAANDRERVRLTEQIEMLGRTCGEMDGKAFIKVETPESLGNLNWWAVSLPGAHPNCVVLVDHWTIESRFSRMLKMLSRYDTSIDRYGEFLAWRNIEPSEVCPACSGAGSRAYANTTAWRGGIGGQTITGGICDRCWGSGNAVHPWTNLRRLEAPCPPA